MFRPKGRAQNNYILVVFDSCRYDSFIQAQPRHIGKLGQVERRWSYCSWTAPSHYNMMLGLLPHSSPKRTFVAEYYKKEVGKFNERLGAEAIRFTSLLPKLYLPTFLK